jgi:hypothetical protein
LGLSDAILLEGMMHSSDPGDLLVLRAQDEVCDRFEQAWRSQGRQEVEGYLSGWDGGARVRLKKELESLQAELSGTDPALESTIVGVAAGTDPQVEEITPAIPPAVGRFVIRERLGQGSFGVVYRAYDPTLDREVALKLPRIQHGDRGSLHRLFEEAKAAARLQHPGIVAVFERGEIDGQFYISSDYIAGRPLSKVIQDSPPTVDQAVEWAKQLAEALEHAHQSGVVHRDVKPDNIMVADRGRLMIMDFGLAKRTDESAQATSDGVILGTPSYMSPEQARGRSSEVGPPADQYSVGVILYEFLTGRRPYRGDSLSVVQQVASDTEPPRPRSLNPAIPIDLEAICLKAMEKSSSARYANCSALARDLENWIEDRPIVARPTRIGSRLIKWVRRNPWLGGLTLALFATLTTSLIVASVLLSQKAVALQSSQDNEREVGKQKGLVEAALGKAQTQTKLAQAETKRADIEKDNAVREAGRANLAAEDARKQTAVAQMRSYRPTFMLAHRAIEDGDLKRARSLLFDTPAELRDWEWRHLKSFLPRDSRSIAPVLLMVDLSPDGVTLAQSNHNSDLIFYDLVSGKVRAKVPSPDLYSAARSKLQFDVSGKRLFRPAQLKRPQGQGFLPVEVVDVFDVATAKRERRLEDVWGFGVSRSPRWLPLLRTRVNPAEAWEALCDLETGEEREIWRGEPTVWDRERRKLSVSADGRRYARQTTTLLEYRDAQTNEIVEEPILQAMGVGYDSTSRDGEWVAGRAFDAYRIGDQDVAAGDYCVLDLTAKRVVSRLEMERAREVLSYFGLGARQTSPPFQFSTDKRYLWIAINWHTSRGRSDGWSPMVTSSASTGYYWEAATGRYLGCAQSNAVAPSGTAHLDGSNYATLPWDRPALIERTVLYPAVHHLGWLSDGTAVTAGEFGGHRPFDALGSSSNGWRVERHPGWIQLRSENANQGVGPITVDEVQDLIYAVRDFPTVTVLRPTGEVVRKIELPMQVADQRPRKLLLGDQGKTLYTLHPRDVVRRWRLDDDTLIDETPIASGEQFDLALSADERLLAVATARGAIVFRDGQIVRDLREPPGGDQPVHQLSFAPDGRRLFLGGGGIQPPRVVDIETGDLVKSFKTEGALAMAGVSTGAFCPTGRRLVTGHSDGILRFWDTQSWELLAELQHRPAPIGRLIFNRDARHLGMLLVIGMGSNFSAEGGLRLLSADLP